MFNPNSFPQPQYQNFNTGSSYYQRPPFYQFPQQLQSFMPQYQQQPQYSNMVRNPHYSQYPQYPQYVPTMKENQPQRIERTQRNPYGDISKNFKKSILAEPLNDQRLQIFIPQDKLQKLAHQLFTQDFNLPMSYSLNKLQFPFNEIKNTVADAIPKFYKLLASLDKQVQQTEHVYNYFMLQPDILPNTLFSGLQHQLQDKLLTVTNKVNQKVQSQLKKGIFGTTQPNINEVKAIRRTEVKQQFSFVDHRKQMRKKLLKLSNNIIESVTHFYIYLLIIYKFLLQHSTGSKLILQQFLQTCLKIITLFQFLCLDNTSLAPFVSFNSALLFDQITIARKRLRPLDFLIITNENYETFARSMKNYQKSFQQFSTRNQNIINQLHQIIVKEAQLEGLSLINFNELANTVLYKEKSKFQTEVLKAYQDIVKRKENDSENYLKNETLVETAESLKKQMEEWQELRNEQVKFNPILQDILGMKLTKDRIERIDPAYEANITQISQIEKAINYVNTLLSKSNDLVENVMAYKQDQEDFLQQKYQDVLDMMHNDLKSKFTYFNINDQIEELFHELKEILKYEKMQSKDITHKIEKQLKKGKYKNEFLKQVQHTIELDKMMRSKEEQFVKTQEENFKMQNYWQQQNIQQLHEQQMMQYYKAQELTQQQLMDFAQTRQLTKLAQGQEDQQKQQDYYLNNQINQISQNGRDQELMSDEYEKQLELMKQNQEKQLFISNNSKQNRNSEIKKSLEDQTKEREAKRQEELDKREQEKQKKKQEQFDAEEKKKEDLIKRQEERAERERKIKEAQEEEERKIKERKEQREQREREEKEKREKEQIEKEQKLKAEKEQKQKDLEEKKRKEQEEKDKREKERLDRAKQIKEDEEKKAEEMKQKREQQKREKEEKEKKDKEEREKRLQSLKEREENEKKEREQKLKEERETKAQREKEEKEKLEKIRKEKEEKELKLKEQRERELKERKQREEKEKKEKEEQIKKEKEEKERKEKERKDKELKDREEKERKLKEEKEKRDKEIKEKKEKEEKDKKEKEERIKQQQELKAQKDKEEKEKKEREDQEKKEKAQKAQKEKEEREKKEKEDKEKKEREIREARERQEQEKLLKEQNELEEKERKLNELKAQKEKEDKDKKDKEKKDKEEKEERKRKEREEKEEQKKQEEKLKNSQKQPKFVVEDADDYFDDFDDDIPLPIESPDTKKQNENDDLIEELMSKPNQPIQAKRMQAMQEFDDALDFDDDEEDEEYKPDFDESNQKSSDKKQQQKGAIAGPIVDPKKVPTESMSDLDKMENEPNFFQPEQLINHQILDINNFYAQSVGIDQIDFNFEEFNNFESVFMLFEEFIIQQNAYFFEFEDGIALEQLSNELTILKQSQNEEDALNTIEPKLQAFFQKVSTQYMQITQAEEFAKQTRYFFPFQNDLSYFLIEVNPFVQRVIIYFTDTLNQEQQQEVAATMENLIQLIFYLLDLSELSVLNIEVHENSKLILKEFESLPYIQYMLAIFYIMFIFCLNCKNQFSYELDLQTFLSYNFMILFDEKIVDRMRLVLQSTKNLTAIMMDQQGLTEYQMTFEEMLQMYDIECIQQQFSIKYQKENPEIGLLVKYLQLDDPQKFQELLTDELASEVQMLRSGKVEHVFLAIDLALEMVKHTYYIYMGKTQPEEQEQTKKKYNLMFYFYHGYSDEINQQIMMSLLEQLGINIEGPNLDQELQNSEFSLQSFFDYVRHQSTMEFPRITLALWVHLSLSRQLGPMNSLMLLSYSQIPNFAEYFMMQDQGLEGLDEEEMKEMMAMQEAQQREAEAAAAAAAGKQKKPAKATKPGKVDKLAPISKDKKKKKIIK